MSTGGKTVVGLVLFAVLALILWDFVSQLFGYAVLFLAVVGIVALVVASVNLIRRRSEKVPVGGKSLNGWRERTAQRELKKIERCIGKP